MSIYHHVHRCGAKVGRSQIATKVVEFPKRFPGRTAQAWGFSFGFGLRFGLRFGFRFRIRTRVGVEHTKQRQRMASVIGYTREGGRESLGLRGTETALTQEISDYSPGRIHLDGKHCTDEPRFCRLLDIRSSCQSNGKRRYMCE